MSESGERPRGPQDPTFGAFDAARDPWARPPEDPHAEETVKLTKDQPAPAPPYQPSSYDPPGTEPPTYIPPDYLPPSYSQPSYGDQSSYDQPTYQQPAYEPPSYAPPPPTVPPYSNPGQGGYGQPYQQPGYPAADPYQQYPAPAYGQAPVPSPYGFGAQPGYQGGGYGSANSGKATAVLILGIASLVTVWCYGIGIIPAIVGLAMSGSAKREIEGSGGRLTGTGMVSAGRVTGWISLGLSVIFIGILIIAGVLSALSDPGGYTGN